MLYELLCLCIICMIVIPIHSVVVVAAVVSFSISVTVPYLFSMVLFSKHYFRSYISLHFTFSFQFSVCTVLSQ